MNRESLAENHGMLFVFPEPGDRAFWMRNTSIPLDIVFIGADRTVRNVEAADPQPNASRSELERYRSDGPATYVIEVNQGFATEHGICSNTTVRLSLE